MTTQSRSFPPRLLWQPHRWCRGPKRCRRRRGGRAGYIVPIASAIMRLRVPGQIVVAFVAKLKLYGIRPG